MTPKEILQKIRETFNELQKHGAEIPQPQEESQPSTIKLKGGIEAQVTDLEIGGVVTINGTPAPSGEHMLEDGTTIVVGDNGVITEIKAASGTMPQPEMEEEMGKKDMKMSEEFVAFQTSTNQKFASYESKFAEYESRFAEYDERLVKATKVIEGLLNLTQTLAETPTGVPDSSIKSTNSFSAVKSESFDILFS